MSIYDQLGISGTINASARWTGLGGSIMKPEVLQAMNEAAGSYVPIGGLQKAAGRRIADLTSNEDAYVTVGATAGLAISLFAATTGGDTAAILRASEQPVTGKHALIHASHRFPFDRAITLVGLSLRTFGTAYGTSRDDLVAAIDDQTAAVVYLAGSHVSGALPLSDVVDICRSNNIPVIVDAAAQLPLKSNLWTYTRDEGADAAIFAGGKELCGPQASGLIVGSEKLIEACRAAGPPSPYLLRAMKTGKEEICGLVRAVELYIEADEDARIKALEGTVAAWNDAFDAIDGVTTERVFPNIDGQPTPRTRIRLDDHRLNASEVVDSLSSGSPHITVMAEPPDALLLSPDVLEPGEDDVVTTRLVEILS